MEINTPEVIKNLRRGYLFALDRSVRGRLNQQRITDEMKTQFTDAGQSLSDSAVVKILVKSREWAILDGESEYSVSQERNSIVFCDLQKVRSQWALARLVGVTQAAISKLESGKISLTKEIADALVEALWLNDKQADVVMIASARDGANLIKAKFDKSMVKLKRQYGDYPQVMLYLGREFN